MLQLLEEMVGQLAGVGELALAQEPGLQGGVVGPEPVEAVVLPGVGGELVVLAAPRAGPEVLEYAPCPAGTCLELGGPCAVQAVRCVGLAVLLLDSLTERVGAALDLAGDGGLRHQRGSVLGDPPVEFVEEQPPRVLLGHLSYAYRTRAGTWSPARTVQRPNGCRRPRRDPAGRGGEARVL